MTPQNATAAPAPWRTGEPPKDGALYVATGNLVVRELDAMMTTAFPFKKFVFWDPEAGEWLDMFAMAIRHNSTDELHFHHHISLPTP